MFVFFFVYYSCFFTLFVDYARRLLFLSHIIFIFCCIFCFLLFFYCNMLVVCFVCLCVSVYFCVYQCVYLCVFFLVVSLILIVNFPKVGPRTKWCVMHSHRRTHFARLRPIKSIH